MEVARSVILDPVLVAMIRDNLNPIQRFAMKVQITDAPVLLVATMCRDKIGLNTVMEIPMNATVQ